MRPRAEKPHARHCVRRRECLREASSSPFQFERDAPSPSIAWDDRVDSLDNDAKRVCNVVARNGCVGTPLTNLLTKTYSQPEVPLEGPRLCDCSDGGFHHKCLLRV